MMKAFRLLAALKGLRGTALDVFGYTAERRMERRSARPLRGRSRPDRPLAGAGQIEAAAALASVPALIRGYGHVKQANVEKAAGERERLLALDQRRRKPVCRRPNNGYGSFTGT